MMMWWASFGVTKTLRAAFHIWLLVPSGLSISNTAPTISRSGTRCNGERIRSNSSRRAARSRVPQTADAGSRARVVGRPVRLQLVEIVLDPLAGLHPVYYVSRYALDLVGFHR